MHVSTDFTFIRKCIVSPFWWRIARKSCQYFFLWQRYYPFSKTQILNSKFLFRKKIIAVKLKKKSALSSHFTIPSFFIYTNLSFYIAFLSRQCDDWWTEKCLYRLLWKAILENNEHSMYLVMCIDHETAFYSDFQDLYKKVT